MTRLILTGASRSGTTISNGILREHSDVWMTNEVRTYLALFREDYFSFIYNKLKGDPGYHRLPPSFNIDSLKDLKEDDPTKRIQVIEKRMFGDRYKVFGDKGILRQGAEVMYNHRIPYKLIIIHRDGRDIISSALRHRNNTWFGSGSIREKSGCWAKITTSQFDFAEEFDVEHLIIRFEDYIDRPGKNMELIENFLGIDGLVSLEKTHIDYSKSNRGYYRNYIPNWQEKFHPDAIKLLSKLEYI